MYKLRHAALQLERVLAQHAALKSANDGSVYAIYANTTSMDMNTAVVVSFVCAPHRALSNAHTSHST